MPGSAAQQLALIADSLRVQANGGLKRSVTKRLTVAVRPLGPKAQAAAGKRLPQAGGLAARVSAERVSVSVSYGASTVGVRLRTAHHDAYATNAGYVRHLVFNRPESWVRQELPDAEGWWTNTLDREAPKVLPAVDSAVEASAREAFNV